MKILHFDTINSTNEYLKKLKSTAEDVLIVADEQTGGKGTKNRKFVSDRGGVYMSLLRLFPCKAENAFTLMRGAALSVCRALEVFGIESAIKWPNDVYCAGKKICGILIENTFSGDMVSRSVIGIGINVNNDIPADLTDIAVSAKEIAGKELSVNVLAATVAYNLYLEYTQKEYEAKNFILGKEITVLKEGCPAYRGVAEKILPNGNLQLKSGEILSAAEVSIR